ncbi:MAG TPA: ATPase, T2SS/T4P/T4SS family, partial [Polyangia bacterium]|nr:ATPase, T2SS/T4P/T4SS family [Polyangia bacterium]
MIKLTLTEKGGEPKLLTFEKDEITIGRVSGNDIVLAKGNVSKRHSRFIAKPGGQIEVADLKSTNGTYVNGRKIAVPTALSANDRVYVGDFLITVDLGEGEEAGEESDNASQHVPVPPPPPPPRGTGSRAAQLPADEEPDAGYGDEDEDELGLAARPPRSGRMPIPPPPPPPPPRRPPTPLASRSVDKLDDDLDDLPPPPPEEDTGSVGLFAHSRPADEDISRRVSVSARPGAAAAAPAFAPVLAAAAPMGGVTDVGNALGLEALLADASVRQVLITAPDAALVDRGAGLTLHDGGLGDPNAVADALWRLANTAFPPPAPDNPVVDVRLPDGSRMTAAFPPAAPGGVVAAIRRPALVERELGDLLPTGARDAETLLAAVVAGRRNVLVTGDVGAVSAALGALGAAIAADRRVVAIGAASPQARGGWMDLAPALDAAGLLRVAAGFRPDHLVIGELAGTEVGELALLAARGQDGILAALPGRSPGDALVRLGALASVALAGSTAAPALAATAFDLILQVVSVS